MSSYPRTLEVTVKASAHQGWIISILLECMRRWGWDITTHDAGGFKAVYR